jgi:two-component system, chemotaxis family, response regulator PixG
LEHQFEGDRVEELTAEKLVRRFQSLQKARLTGVLSIFSNHTPESWNLYFQEGQIFWTGGGKHRFRRWYRALKEVSPQLDPQTIRLRENETDVGDLWDYLALSVLFKRCQITQAQMQGLIQKIVYEVIFDIFQSCDLVNHPANDLNLQDLHERSTQISAVFKAQPFTEEPLHLINIESAIHDVTKLWSGWCNAGLAHCSPNLAPVLKRPDELKQQLATQAYESMQALLNGNSPLRELSMVTQRDLLPLTRSLLPLLKRDLIGLQEVIDLNKPTPALTTFSTVVRANQPLVVCVDDNHEVRQSLSQIFTQAGYRFIGIEDSFQALPTILLHKPDLIFLDLIMPVASGYEVCAQIRRVSALKNVPVVILTGNDGIVDRVRAKFVGASDFLGKPVQQEKVMAVVTQYLGQGNSPSFVRAPKSSDLVAEY